MTVVQVRGDSLLAARSRVHTLADWLRGPRRFGFLVTLLTALTALAVLLPNAMRPLVTDEAEFGVAARVIQERGVPIFYRGETDPAALGLVPVVRGAHVAGFPGLSAVLSTPDGFTTFVQHGAAFYVVGNWHPPLYLYLLAIFATLPIPFEAAARLLNGLCLETSALLIYALVAGLLGRLGASAAWRRGLSLAAALAFILHPFVVRGHVLVDFTSTLSVTTLLLFFLLRLVSRPTWRWTLAQVAAFTLVAWSNLGPVPALALVLAVSAVVDALTRHWRRALQAAVALAGGLALFYATYALYSAWLGVPASLTFQHSNARVAASLGVVFPVHWRVGGPLFGMAALWALLLGPAVLALLVAIFVRRHPSLRGRIRWSRPRLVVALVAGVVVLTALGLVAFALLQGVAVPRALLAALEAPLAVAKAIGYHWLRESHLEWMPPLLGVSALILADGPLPILPRPAGRAEEGASRTLRELTLFALVLSADLLLIGADAWGFAKYEVPVLAVALPPLAIFIFVVSTQSRQLSPRALALVLAAAVLVCAAMPLAAAYSARRIPGVTIRWDALIAAAAVLIAGFAITLPAARGTGRQNRAARLAMPLVLLACAAPLLIATGVETAGLPNQRGSVTYNEGTGWGIRAAGEYLRDHAQPGDELRVTKDVGAYTGLPYNPYTPPATCAPGRVTWAARPTIPGPGYQLVWRGPELNVYRCGAGTLPTR